MSFIYEISYSVQITYRASIRCNEVPPSRSNTSRYQLLVVDPEDVRIAGGLDHGRFQSGRSRREVRDCDRVLFVLPLFTGPHISFFRYCQRHFGQGKQGQSPEDDMLNAPRQSSVIRTTVLPNGEKHEEDVDLLTDFSWRNFFSTINFAKIMQKLSKHRSHRIRMLVQYKSSVRSSMLFFSLCGISYIEI